MADLLSLFPPASELADDGMLVVGGCRADDLAEEFGTPVLVVAEQALRATAQAYKDGLRDRWPNSRVVFARDGRARLVVRRETWDELTARDVD